MPHRPRNPVWLAGPPKIGSVPASVRGGELFPQLIVLSRTGLGRGGLSCDCAPGGPACYYEGNPGQAGPRCSLLIGSPDGQHPGSPRARAGGRLSGRRSPRVGDVMNPPAGHRSTATPRRPTDQDITPRGCRAGRRTCATGLNRTRASGGRPGRPSFRQQSRRAAVGSGPWALGPSAHPRAMFGNGLVAPRARR